MGRRARGGEQREEALKEGADGWQAVEIRVGQSWWKQSHPLTFVHGSVLSEGRTLICGKNYMRGKGGSIILRHI